MKQWVKKTIGPVILGAMIVAAFTTGGSAGTARPRGLVAHMQDASGASVGKVRFIPKDDGKVIVKARVSGLTPGFHGFHVHTAGACDPDAQDTAGATVPFFTAGGHYNPVTTNSHGLHAGDMPPLLVTDDGSAVLRLATDRFRNRDLLDEDGSAVIIHAGPDNLAHVPATTPAGGERYHSHVDDVFGPDTATRATGDAGARFACGVVTKAPR